MDFCGGIRNFAELGLLLLIFLACGENGFLQGGRRAFHADERPVDAYIAFAIQIMNKERLLLPVVGEEVQPIEFFTCERFKYIQEILLLGGVHKQVLDFPECGILSLEKGKGFVEARLKIPRFANGGGGHAGMREVAGIAERSLMARGQIRSVLGAPIVGVPLLQSACGKCGGRIGFNDERHILCLVVRIPFRFRTGAGLRLPKYNIGIYLPRFRNKSGR